MGYYTTFKLSIKKAPIGIDEDAVIREFRTECEDAEYALQENGRPDEPCKWYSHEHDMRSFSKKHPNIIFELYGEGEEAGDIWVKYFKNGKMQETRAKIEFDDFNMKKLV